MAKDAGLIRLCGVHELSAVELTTKKIDDGFGGVETCGTILFTLDGVTYEMVEDPDDGYRSYHRDIHISDCEPKYKFPSVKVLCYMMEDTPYDNNNIIVMRDLENGETILEAGTENYDDYYPCCHFEWMPEKMAVNEKK